MAFIPYDGSLAFANIRPIGQVYVETGINEKGILNRGEQRCRLGPDREPGRHIRPCRTLQSP